MMGTDKWNSSFIPCMRDCAGLLAIASLLAFAAGSDAAIITISNGESTVTLDSESDGLMENLGGERFRWTGSSTLPRRWDFEWTIEADPDPFISAVYGFTSSSGATSEYNTTLSIPASDFPIAGSSMSGKVVLSINDGNNSGSATIAAPVGKAIYTALIDGADEHELFPAPYSLTTSDTDPASANFSGFSSQDVDASIAIRTNFVISAFDKATINSRFEVLIPEPAGAALAVLGIFGFGLIRQRR